MTDSEAQPMPRERFAARLAKRLHGPAAEKVVAAILADADQYAAHEVEQHARPVMPTATCPPFRVPRAVGGVSELPGGEQ